MKVKLTVVRGDIDEVVISCLERLVPGWAWQQEDTGRAVGVWREDRFNCLFDATDLSKTLDLFSVRDYEEFVVIDE